MLAALNLLKSSPKPDTSEDETCDETTTTADDQPDDGGDESASAGELRTRISFRDAAATSFTGSRHRPSLSHDHSASSAPGDVVSSATSSGGGTNTSNLMAPLHRHLTPSRLINLRDAREGARRFAFLLETSEPGRLPDAPLIAALLELVSL